MGGLGWGGGLKDYSGSPSPSPFPLDFGFGIWNMDLGLDLGLTINSLLDIFYFGIFPPACLAIDILDLTSLSPGV